MSLLTHTGTVPLETARLLLRPHRIADADDVFARWASDPAVSRFWSWEPHREITESRRLLQLWSDAYTDPAYYHWAIVSRADDRPIGAIFLNEIDEADRSASVHFLLARSCWNLGLTTEACRCVIRFAFCRAGFRRIRSRCHTDNPASGRVLEKCGMVCTGETLRTLEPARISGRYRLYQIENA